MTEGKDLLIIDQVKQEQENPEVKEAFKQVFLSQLAQERKYKLPNEDINAFISRRMPVYFDAVDRGYPSVRQKLETGEFRLDVIRGEGVKKYKIEGDNVSWEITSKSDDIFDLADFNKKMQALRFDTKGEGDVFADPHLVKQMLDEGLKQQRRVYDDFMHLYALTKRVMEGSEILLDHFKPPLRPVEWLTSPLKVDFETPLSKISQIEKVYRRTFIKGSSSVDRFVEKFVVESDPILGKFKDIEEISDNLIRLQTLFEEGNKERKRHESTLAVELITNSDDLNKPHAVRNPSISQERLSKTLEFIKELKKGSSPEELNQKLAIVVQSVIDNNRDRIKEIFEAEGISFDLGIDYLQSVLNKTLREMSSEEFAEKTYKSDDGGLMLEKMFSVKAFEKDLSEPVEPIEEDLSDLEVREVIISGRYFNRFRGLSTTQRFTFINMIVNHELLKDENKARHAISSLLENLGFKFYLSKKRFIPPTYEKKLGWEVDCGNRLLEECLGQVKEKNKVFIKIFEDLVVEQGIPDYLLEKNPEINSNPLNFLINGFEDSVIGMKDDLTALNQQFTEVIANLLLKRLESGTTIEQTRNNIIATLGNRYYLLPTTRNNIDNAEYLKQLEGLVTRSTIDLRKIPDGEEFQKQRNEQVQKVKRLTCNMLIIWMGSQKGQQEIQGKVEQLKRRFLQEVISPTYFEDKSVAIGSLIESSLAA